MFMITNSLNFRIKKVFNKNGSSWMSGLEKLKMQFVVFPKKILCVYEADILHSCSLPSLENLIDI